MIPFVEPAPVSHSEHEDVKPAKAKDDRSYLYLDKIRDTSHMHRHDRVPHAFTSRDVNYAQIPKNSSFTISYRVQRR